MLVGEAVLYIHCIFSRRNKPGEFADRCTRRKSIRTRPGTTITFDLRVFHANVSSTRHIEEDLSRRKNLS